MRPVAGGGWPGPAHVYTLPPMQTHRRFLWRAILLFSLVWLGVTASAQAADETLRVGSKRFTESYILAELLAQTAAPHTASPPVVRQGLGNTAIVYEALRSGAIDLYAEYTGTIALEILKGSPAETREAMNAALAPMGLGVAIPLGFNDGYALAVRAADADRLGLRTLSDLA
ncbi:glycine betaine ABC transporter substrate-binding protein, partial [Variovorax sp. KBW07]|uniref:glycine betaine ABC transporter substrate-binding protein n=1 Tax=Variovorax sp. KBW07 TaxID=2153358 RepID=UPI00288A006C